MFKKSSISDLVANTMNNILNSEEHNSLFKKAYDTKSHCSKCGHASDMCSCNYADDNFMSDKKHFHTGETCKDCGKSSDMCSCGDGGMMADDDSSWVMDASDSSHGDHHDASDGGHHNSSSHHDASDSSKMATAFNSALKDLITASAALDYVGLDKASELTLKIASLVSEAKKRGKEVLEEESSKSSKSSKSPKSSSSSRALSHFVDSLPQA